MEKNLKFWSILPLLAVAMSSCHTDEPDKNGTTNKGEMDIFASMSYDEMVYVEGGTFVMGAQPGDNRLDNYDSNAAGDESPIHIVTLSSYYIGKYEVTQQLWEYVMNYSGLIADGNSLSPAPTGSYLPDANPTVKYGKGDNYPVYNVYYEYIVEQFIPRLNKITGKTFALPTEAQWEYAARGGRMSQSYIYSGSNAIDEVAWYTSNSDNTNHPVGRKMANELGVYDMSGNVWEWCSDYYGKYNSVAEINPTGPKSGNTGVVRGGCMNELLNMCRVANREECNYEEINPFIGFRLVCNP